MVEQKISGDKRSEAILQGQTGILRKIIANADMFEILRDIIHLMETLEPEMKSSILFLDDMGVHLTHGIAPSLPEAYVKAIDGSAIGPEEGSCGTAAFTGKLTIVEDIATDVRWRKYARFALPHNLRACWSMPIRTQDGKILGTFAMYYDEVRKPAQEELELLDFMVNLARLTIEKSRSEEAKVHYEKMIVEQNGELIKINKELDSFVYKASHDLRAPLSSILGLINLAHKSAESNAELNALLSHMEKSVTRLDDYVKELIDHSRNLRMQKETVIIDFNELIHKSIADLAYMEAANNVHWEIETETTHPFKADKSRLTIVLNNLIANAIRYSMNNKKARVKITANANEELAVLMVEDNGIGIEKENLCKIFDMFYRASEATPGSGLGLYIVKETVENLAGSIEVISSPGIGTTFTVTIPNQK
jgi:signal transduction histidine kinase